MIKITKLHVFKHTRIKNRTKSLACGFGEKDGQN